MFDFLFMEEWWMETVIAALIAAIGGILAARVGLSYKLNKLNDKADHHEERSGERKAALSKEHDAITAALSKEHNALTAGLEKNTKLLTYLREERIRDIARQESMKEQRLDIRQAMDILTAATERITELERQLTEARTEISRLQAENDRLRSRWEYSRSDELEEDEELER